MKKLLKITAVLFIIFALVTNLYATLFSYYGIKTNNLEGAVWASSLATTSNSSGGSSGTTGTSTWFNLAVNTSVQCGAMNYSGSTTNHGAASVSYTTSPAGTVTATVSYASGSSSSYTGTIPAHTATMVQCVGPLAATFCLNTSAQEACQ